MGSGQLLGQADKMPFFYQPLLCSFQVVITYVAYLCARLLDLREETKAARCIQMAWRRHRLLRQLERKTVCEIEKLVYRFEHATVSHQITESLDG